VDSTGREYSCFVSYLSARTMDSVPSAIVMIGSVGTALAPLAFGHGPLTEISYCGFGFHLFVLWDSPRTHSCNTGISSHLGDTSIVGVVSTSGFSPSSVVVNVRVDPRLNGRRHLCRGAYRPALMVAS
jgi:hypothetical protein